MPDAAAHFARVRRKVVELGKELSAPAFDALGLVHLQPLRDEVAARVGASPGSQFSGSPVVARLRLESLLTDADFDDFGLVSLAPLRAEVEALVRPRASARMVAARGPAQTTLGLP